MPALLSDAQINEELTNLPGWARSEDLIEKNFKVKDFASALAFVNAIGNKAEEMDHHPDILLHSWNQVKVMLSTHSEKGITGNDIALAKEVEGIQ